MAALRWIVVAILASLCSCHAYNIMLVFPLPGKSHSILGDGYVRHLLAAGHEVTYITPFPWKNAPPKLNQIDVSANLQYTDHDRINIKHILDKKTNTQDMSSLLPIILNVARNTMEHADLQKLYYDPNIKFDVIIVEWIYSEVTSGLSTVFGCPYIWSSSVEPHWMVLKIIDETLNPSYNPDLMSTSTAPFSFRERMSELGKQIVGSSLKKFMFTPMEEELYKRIFGPVLATRGQELPPYETVVYNSSLMLGNSHVSLGQATRLPQSYKAIAGYHIDDKVNPLPEDLKKLIENAKNGVIYFSMGSNLKSKDIPESIKKSLLKMFEELKYTVLWKFEEVLSDLPKNVHILQWAPQQSILAHPNCVLFITHGGLLSITETVHYGVPIIGVPVFADQFLNVDRAVNKGFAKRVNLSYTMADKLKVAIEEILSDSKYRNKVKELSQIYHDRPVAPGRELVHWVEHVVRTRGAPHLRSPALLLPWYQKTYLDLAALLALTVFLLKIALTRLFCSSMKIDKDKKKK